jgi:arylsulfatase
MKPNILLIFTDQQRYDTIEALGNPVIKTPALNSLVEDGVWFNRAYTPCPVCVPARYSMMTGRMPHETDCVDNQVMPEGNRSFIEHLADAGYQTHGVGKMHFTFKGTGALAKWGYDSRNVSEEGAAQDDFREYLKEEGFGHVYDAHGVRSDMYYIPQPSQLPDRLHNTRWVVDKSIDFLERRDGSRPFYLMTSFIKPHPPFESPTPWNKLYRGPEMPLPKRPENWEKLITFWNRVQNRYKYRDQGIDDNLVRCIRAAYYSCISYIDFQLGRLFEYLKEQGIYEDTMIVFTADHGEMLGDYNSFGKRNFLDPAARIPMICKYPGCEKGGSTDQPASLVDIFPTFLRFSGVDHGESVCGESLMDIAEGRSRRDSVYGQFQRNELGMYMCVTERYKYIYSAPDDREWLYDLRVDPDETRNRAYNPMYMDTLLELRRKTIQRFRQDGYDAPFEGDDWNHYELRDVFTDPDAFLLFQDPPQSIPHIPGYERERLDQVKSFIPGLAGRSLLKTKP